MTKNNKYTDILRFELYLKLLAFAESKSSNISCEIEEALHIIQSLKEPQLIKFLESCPEDKFKEPFRVLCRGLANEYKAQIINFQQIQSLLSRIVDPPESYVWKVKVESSDRTEEVTATFHNHFITKGTKTVWQHSVNPNYGIAVTDATSGYGWAKSLGVDYTKLKFINPTLLGCLTLPKASDLGASTNSKMVCWLFCHDDANVDIDIPAGDSEQDRALADLEKKIQDYMKISEHFGPESKRLSEQDIIEIKERNPQTALLFDLLEDLNKMEGDKHFFYMALKRYLASNVDELEREINIKRHPELVNGLGDSYLNQRKIESSLELVFELGLLAMGATIPQEVRELKLWKDLYDAAVLQVAGANDLSSLPKEVLWNLHSNYYILFKRATDSFQEAVTSSNIRTFDGLPNKFELTAKLLQAKISSNGLAKHAESVDIAVSVLRSWQSNHLLWEDISTRHPKR